MKNMIIGMMTVIIIVMTGIIFYNYSNEKEKLEVSSGDDSLIIDDDSNETTTSYSISDIHEKVYGRDTVSYNMVLWNDETFEYINDITKEKGIGYYRVLDDKIYLDFVYAMTYGTSEYKLSNLKKEITIVRKLEYGDKLELKDGDLLVTTLDQPARSGDDFNTALQSVINVYNDSLK